MNNDNDTNTDANLAPDIIRSTQRTKLLLSALLLLVLCVAVLIQFVAIPFITSALAMKPPSNTTIIKTGLAAFAGIATLTGLATIWHGQKIRRSGQYPLANAWVWRDTIVKRGRKAINIAWLHIVTGLLICIIGIGITAYTWRIIDLSVQLYNLSKDFIILEQKSGSRP